MKTKRWFRYGVYTLLLLIIYGLFLELVNLVSGSLTPISIYSNLVILYIPNLILKSLLMKGASIETVIFYGRIILWVTTPILWFGIGAIIGLIVDKIKVKKG